MLFVVGLLMAIGVLTRRYMHILSDAEVAARARGMKEVVEAAARIDASLQPLVQTTTVLRDDIASGKYDSQNLQDHLKELLAANDKLLEVSVAYAPNVAQKGALSGPSCAHRFGVVFCFQLNDNENYVTTHWYRDAVSHGVTWFEPAIGKNVSVSRLGIAMAAYQTDANGKRQLIAVVRVCVASSQISKVTSAMTIGESRFGYLISQGGEIITHPITRFMDRNAFDGSIGFMHEQPARVQCQRDALRGETATAEGESEVSDERIYAFCAPVSTPKWALVLIYSKKDMLGVSNALTEKQVQLSLCVFAALTLLLVMLFGGERDVILKDWGRSAVIAGIGVMTIAFNWRLIIDSNDIAEKTRTFGIFSQDSLDNFEATQANKSPNMQEVQPTFIPSGVQLETVQLDGSNQATISGFAWQKYQAFVEDDIARGFILPDSIDSEFTPTYTRKEGDRVIVGWHFRATLRGQFNDSTRYPFDTTHLRIRLWHKEFDKKMILVPDLDSYRILIPGTLPGLPRGVRVAGWSLQSTFFDYLVRLNDANFGIATLSAPGTYPELSYNVLMKREFIDPFFSNLIQVIMVLGIGFAVLMSGTGMRKLDTMIGFSPLNALSVGASILFVVLIAQANLRDKVQSTQLVFLEYFYFLAYFVIAFVCAFAVYMGIYPGQKTVVLERAVRLAYWPAVVVFVLTITIAKFY